MMETVNSAPVLDRTELEDKVRHMYRDVAENPQGEFHFEMGRAMAERLGYPPEDLDRIPAEAIDSFAGVGYFFHLADVRPGDRVLDLGSGSGMDSFIAALAVGGGEVVGIDMTQAQLRKAERLRDARGIPNVRFIESHIESVPVDDGSFDLVISNGVINLSADKRRVFSEASRALKPGGKLALADIVTESQLPENVTCNATLWAACIGGAAQQDNYRNMIEEAGLTVVTVQENREYRFLSKSARGATETWGVKSVSLLAVKNG
jgi:ubiquinone/menaquinone biosynthesis C-methylase UbiE